MKWEVVGGQFQSQTQLHLVRYTDYFQTQKYLCDFQRHILLQPQPQLGCSWGPCFPVNHCKTRVSTWAHSLAWGNKDVSHPLIRGWQVTHLTPKMGNTWLINCLVTHPATLTPRWLTPAAHPSTGSNLRGGRVLVRNFEEGREGRETVTKGKGSRGNQNQRDQELRTVIWAGSF